MRRPLVVLSLLVLAGLTTAGPAAAKVAPGPAGDAFYTPPKALTGKAHGAPIWQRALSGPAALRSARRNVLVLYRSIGVDGRAAAVSGTVAVPKGKVPRGGWPVVTYAHGTTGIADQCAPSRDALDNPAHAYDAYIYPLQERWLKAGYAVVRTDYEGLGTPGTHPYLVGTSEGRSVLDMVRAARAVDPQLSKRVLITGHSQGGHAALFAAALAPKWTPELKVRGTVAYAPAARLDEQTPLTRVLTAPSGLTGLVAMIARGVDVAAPSVNVPGLLSEQALALYPRTLTECLPQLSSADGFGAMAPKDLFAEGADLTPTLKVLDASDPANLRIRTPVLIEQGDADTTVLKIFTDQLRTELVKRKTNLRYRVWPGVDHVGVVTTAAKASTTWMLGRLR